MGNTYSTENQAEEYKKESILKRLEINRNTWIATVNVFLPLGVSGLRNGNEIIETVCAGCPKDDASCLLSIRNGDSRNMDKRATRAITNWALSCTIGMGLELFDCELNKEEALRLLNGLSGNFYIRRLAMIGNGLDETHYYAAINVATTAPNLISFDYFDYKRGYEFNKNFGDADYFRELMSLDFKERRKRTGNIDPRNCIQFAKEYVKVHGEEQMNRYLHGNVKWGVVNVSNINECSEGNDDDDELNCENDVDQNGKK